MSRCWLVALLAIVVACAGRSASSGAVRHATTTTACPEVETAAAGGQASAVGDSLLRLYTDSEVTVRIRPVVTIRQRVDPPAEEILRLGVPQRAVVRFTVDTLGRVEPCSLALLEATHRLWGDAALRQARAARFYPARRGPRAVRQTVTMPFTFSMKP
jgi:TonB family protein